MVTDYIEQRRELAQEGKRVILAALEGLAADGIDIEKGIFKNIFVHREDWVEGRDLITESEQMRGRAGGEGVEGKAL